MPKYVFRDGPIPIKNAADADPQQIGDALERISNSVGGEMKPEHVVDAARASRHPLHRYFEWNDAKAAAAHRLDQARQLIRIIRVEDEEDEVPKMVYISVADKSGVAYRTISDIQGSRDLQFIVLRQAERDLLSFERRYREISDLCDVIRLALKVVQSKRRGDDRDGGKGDDDRPSA